MFLHYIQCHKEIIHFHFISYIFPTKPPLIKEKDIALLIFEHFNLKNVAFLMKQI